MYPRLHHTLALAVISTEAAGRVEKSHSVQGDLLAAAKSSKSNRKQGNIRLGAE